ncbi:MAG: GNAT family N-acetyltransferase [Planctomycetota bacterium]|nr:GNAT family N-acetyltransferase [Planctomycetota bacterium]
MPSEPALAGDLSTIVVTDRAALDGFEEQWNALLARSAIPLPICGPAWFLAHIDHKRTADCRWWCAFAFAGDRLVGVLPLVSDPRSRGGLRDPSEYFMHDGAPVLEPGREAEVANALLEAAYAEVPEARRLAFGGLRDSPVLDALRAQSWTSVRQEGMGSAVRIEGAFEDWKRTIGSNMRRNLRKAANRVERDFGAPPQAEFLTGDDAPLELLDEMARIEQTGWKAEEGGAMGLRTEVQAIYADVIAGWKRAGFLEWHRLRFGERTVALHLATHIGPKLTLVRICFDESVGRYSPGGLLLMATFERAFADAAIHRVDCVERQPWQQNWRMEAVPYHDVHAFRPGLLTLVTGYAPERIGSALRESRFLRRLLHRAPAESA